ncbi:MAG: hypothetical protein U5K29_06530 [Acidimicrobiales bacterium]|nr:hypothetical protein [Acidimicrobiales bacterium]
MPGPYDRQLEPHQQYTYTLDSESGHSSVYSDPPTRSGGYSSQLAPDSTANAYYSEPRPPSGYAQALNSPGGSYSTPTKPTASGPTDDAIDSMLAGSGGRITSRMMRQLERKSLGDSTGSKLPQWPPAPPSSTEQKRQKIMSRVNKTKTTDSEGGDLSFAGRDGPLAGKQLVDHYQGEDKGVAWRTNLGGWARGRGLDPSDPDVRKQWEQFRDSDQVTTRYDHDPHAREKSRLKEKANGKVKTTHDRREYNDYADEHGWVMSPDTGSIHTFDHTNHQRGPDGKQVNMHHSSPLAGGNVAGAGLMKIEDKHITEVTDESGHYRPEGEYTYQAVNEMAGRGLLDRKAKSDDRDVHQSGRGNLSARVTLGGAVGRDGRPGKGWLNDEEGIYKGNLTLPYQAFLQTRGNERQARAKVAMQEELLGKTPKTEATSEGRGASSLGSGQSQEAPPTGVGTYVEDDFAPKGTYVEDDFAPKGTYVEDDFAPKGTYVEDDFAPEGTYYRLEP